MLQVFQTQKKISLKCKGQIVQCILCACRLEIKPTKDLPSLRKQGTCQIITKKSCERDLDGDLYRTSFKAEIPYCFLRKKQFLTEGKSELTMLSFHLKRYKKHHFYLKRKKTCKALFPSAHQFAHSTVKVSRTKSLKNLKKPANHLDALLPLKHQEIGHPKVDELKCKHKYWRALVHTGHGKCQEATCPVSADIWRTE